MADVYKRQIHELEGKRIRLECDGSPVRLSLDSYADVGVFIQIQLEDKTKELGVNLSSCTRRRARVNRNPNCEQGLHEINGSYPIQMCDKEVSNTYQGMYKGTSYWSPHKKACERVRVLVRMRSLE